MRPGIFEPQIDGWGLPLDEGHEVPAEHVIFPSCDRRQVRLHTEYNLNVYHFWLLPDVELPKQPGDTAMCLFLVEVLVRDCQRVFAPMSIEPLWGYTWLRNISDGGGSHLAVDKTAVYEVGWLKPVHPSEIAGKWGETAAARARKDVSAVCLQLRRVEGSAAAFWAAVNSQRARYKQPLLEPIDPDRL